MNAHARQRTLSDAEIRQLAEYFYTTPPEPEPKKAPEKCDDNLTDADIERIANALYGSQE